MNLKTYLFNKSVIKSDLKRFWWIAVIHMLILAIFVLPRVIRIDMTVSRPEIYTVSDEGLIAFVMGFFIAGMVFSYIHKGNAVSMAHSMPLTRKNLYFSHIISGFILLVIPVVIGCIVIVLEGVGLKDVYEPVMGEAIKYSIKYFYTNMIYLLLSFFIVTFMVMISGNTIAAYLFGGAAIVLPLFVYIMAGYIMNNNLYGFSGFDSNIMSYIYIGSVEEMWSLRSLLYVVLIILLFTGSLMVYKARNLENYDEIIAFNFIKPVFVFGVSLCFGLFGMYVINNTADTNTFFLGSIPLGVSAIAGANMINKKSFTIKGILKPVVLYVALIGVVKLTFVYDLTGYERYVPDAENVVSIEPYKNISDVRYSQYYCGDVRSPSYADAVNLKIEVTSEEDIKKIEELHKFIVENRNEVRKEDFQGFKNPVWVEFKYNIKGGRTVERKYTIDEELYSSYLKGYYENPNYKLAEYPILSDRNKTIRNIVYNGNGKTNGEISLRYSDYGKITEALKKDIEGLDYNIISDMNKGYECGEYISVNYTETVNYGGRDYTYSYEEMIELNRYFKNTLNYINEELPKYSDKLINEDSIKGVYMVFDSYYDYDEGGEVGKNVSVTDKEEVMKILNALKNNAYIEGDGKGEFHTVDITFTTDGYQTYSAYINKPYSEIPAEIIKYMN